MLGEYAGSSVPVQRLFGGTVQRLLGGGVAKDISVVEPEHLEREDRDSEDDS